MTVLSDATIRALMAEGHLVVGEASQAVHCSYEFLPGKIFPGGHLDDHEFVVDWTDAAVRSSNARHTIEPSAVVWIRALHTVRLPKNVCGLWIKTNTLSRQGLMLINSSLVEPGYEGHLSCNFVNFGKAPVYLTPNTPIAKLLFFKLDSDALVPFDTKIPQYDDVIARTAAQGPSSFLQISEMAVSLQAEREYAVREITDKTKKLIDEAGPAIKLEREKEFDALKSDFQGYLYKALGGVALVVVLLAAISWLSDWYRGNLSSDRVKKDEVEALVEKEVAKRMTGAACAAAPQLATPSLSQAPTNAPPAQPAAPTDPDGR